MLLSNTLKPQVESNSPSRAWPMAFKLCRRPCRGSPLVWMKCRGHGWMGLGNLSKNTFFFHTCKQHIEITDRINSLSTITQTAAWSYKRNGKKKRRRKLRNLQGTSLLFPLSLYGPFWPMLWHNIFVQDRKTGLACLMSTRSYAVSENY